MRRTVSWSVLTFSSARRSQCPGAAGFAAGLKKIGQIVDPACTAKLYRPLMPTNDFNTYWPRSGRARLDGPLYPGVTMARDQSFGPNPKDVVDIFTADKGGGNRPMLIYVPGGAGNKIEQQAREGNAFYDNIGRWAAKNGMVGVTVQRHPGQNWDDGGRYFYSPSNTTNQVLQRRSPTYCWRPALPASPGVLGAPGLFRDS